MYQFYKKYEYLFIALFVLIAQLSVLPFIRDSYPDTDNYTHARRILDLITTKNWVETAYIHTNYPFGESLPYTRITDIFWLFFSSPLFFFIPLKAAIFWGGMVYQTGVTVLSALALFWVLKPFTSPFLRLVGVCLFFLQSSISESYILIKPDHHVLTVLFGLLTVASLVHFLINPKNKYLILAGIFSALNVWVSIEGLLISYALISSLSILFLWAKIKSKDIANYALYFFISALICLLINPPYEGLFYPDNGRLSILLVTIMSFTSLAMFLISWLEQKDYLPTPIHKALALFITASIFTGLLFLIFGKTVILQPYFPPFIKEIWANNVLELQPTTKNLVIFTLGSSASVFAVFLSIFIYRFFNSEQKKTLVFFFVPLVIFTLLSLTSIRLGRLASIFSIFPLILSFTLLQKKHQFSEKIKGIFLAICYVSFLAFLSLNYVSVNQLFLPRRPNVRIVKPYIPNTEGSILADIFLGPEIIWELDEKVIAAPYHRNVEGIADNFWMLEGENTETTLFLLKKHRVKSILIYTEIPGEPNLFYNINWRYAYLSKMKNANSLLMQLISGKNIPCGITEDLNAPVPFLLFHVNFDKCDTSLSKKTTNE